MNYPAASSDELSRLLGKESPVVAGDRIKLQTGQIFTGPFHSYISAPTGDGIRIEGSGASRLDGGTQNTDHVLSLHGGGVTVSGIEVTHNLAHFTGAGTPSPAGFAIEGDNCKIQQCRIHDCGTGLQSFSGGRNLTVQDNDFYYCGFSELDHAMYMHNPTSGYKRVMRNRVWGNQAFPLHWWGSADVRDMFAFENVFWNNAIGHIVCGGSLMARLQFFRNAGWYPQDANFTHLNCSLENAQDFQETGHDDLRVMKNYFSGGAVMVNCSWWRHVWEYDNVYVGADNGRPIYLKMFMGSRPPALNHCIYNTSYVGDDPRFQYGPLDGFISAGFDDWRKFSGGLDIDSRVIPGPPRLNYYHIVESPDGVLTVAVFNWQHKPVVLVPIMNLPGWKRNDLYSVEYCGAPGNTILIRRIFDGHMLVLPMVDLPPSPQPARAMPDICTRTSAPDFAVFLIRKVS